MVHYLSSSSCTFLQPPLSLDSLVYLDPSAPPLFLGMHVTSGEVVTSVECGHRIGRYLTDVIEADYTRLAPLYSSLAAGCNRHREMVHDSSKPQFSKAVRTERSPYVSPSSSTWRFLHFPLLPLLPFSLFFLFLLISLHLSLIIHAIFPFFLLLKLPDLHNCFVFATNRKNWFPQTPTNLFLISNVPRSIPIFLSSKFTSPRMEI